jgi:hypothetical protein
MPRFVLYKDGQKYLQKKFGIPPVHDRHFRRLIIAGIAPEPVNITPGRKAFTDEQLDAYGEAMLARVSVAHARTILASASDAAD